METLTNHTTERKMFWVSSYLQPAKSSRAIVGEAVTHVREGPLGVGWPRTRLGNIGPRATAALWLLDVSYLWKNDTDTTRWTCVTLIRSGIQVGTKHKLRFKNGDKIKQFKISMVVCPRQSCSMVSHSVLIKAYYVLPGQTLGQNKTTVLRDMTKQWDRWG